MHLTSFRLGFGAAVALGIVSGVALAAGDLSRQTPIEVTVDLGERATRIRAKAAQVRDRQALQTDPAQREHRSALLHLACVLADDIHPQGARVQQRDGKDVTLAEFKGSIREIEVYPGHSAEWWFVPIAAGRVSDLRCDIKGSDGKTHAELGMTGEIVIE